MSDLDIRRFREGDGQPTAPELNVIGGGAKRMRLASMGGSLQGHRTRSGLAMSSNPTLPILATISGSTSPYSWAEVGGSGRTGTSNAYEINEVAGLGGKKTALFPAPTGEMYFQDIRMGGATAAVRFAFNLTAFGDPSTPRDLPGCLVDVYSGIPGSGGVVVETLTADVLGVINVTVAPTGTTTRYFLPAPSGAFYSRFSATPSNSTVGPLNLTAGGSFVGGNFNHGATGPGYNQHALIGYPIKNTLTAVSSTLASRTITCPDFSSPWSWGLNNATGLYPAIQMAGANDSPPATQFSYRTSAFSVQAAATAAIGIPSTTSTPNLLTVTLPSTYGGTWTIHE